MDVSQKHAETNKHFRTGTQLKATCWNNIRGRAGVPGAQGIAEVTLLRPVTPDVYDKWGQSPIKSGETKRPPTNIGLKSGCPVSSKLQRASQNLAGSCVPLPHISKNWFFCKGRNCSLVSVFLHALTISLEMLPSSQAGRRAGEGTGTRQPGDAAVRALLLSIPEYPSPFTWGCSRHGNGRMFLGRAENQLFPLLSPISIPQRSPSCILVRPVRSPVHPSARQQQVLGIRRGWHAACKAAAGLRH